LAVNRNFLFGSDSEAHAVKSMQLRERLRQLPDAK
jgi:hypothetical protein